MPVTSEVIPGMTRERMQNKKAPTAAYKLWHNRYRCQIQQMHLYEAQFIETGGMVTSGDTAVDEAMARNWVEVMLTPAAMAIFHSEGIAFKLNDHKSAADIYVLIYEHQQNWRSAMATRINLVEAPTDDLRKLDELAAELYRYARPYLQSMESFHGKLGSALDNIRRRRGGIRRRLEEAAAPVSKVAEEHTPMAKTIEEMMVAKTQRIRPWQ